MRGLQKADKRKRTSIQKCNKQGKRYLYSLMNGAIKNRIEAQREESRMDEGEREIVKTRREW